MKIKVYYDVTKLINLEIPHASEGGEYFKKGNCCPYHKVRKEFAEHVVKVHNYRSSVKRILAMKKALESMNKTSQPAKEIRKAINAEFRDMRAKGNFKRNTIPSTNTGKLIVARRLAKNLGIKRSRQSPGETSSNTKNCPSTSESNTNNINDGNELSSEALEAAISAEVQKKPSNYPYN